MPGVPSAAPEADAFSPLLEAIEAATAAVEATRPGVQTIEALVQEREARVTETWNDLRAAIKAEAAERFPQLRHFFAVVGAACDPPRHWLTVRNSLAPDAERTSGPEATRRVTLVALDVLREKRAEVERLAAHAAA